MQAWGDYLDDLRAGRRDAAPIKTQSPRPSATSQGQIIRPNIGRKDQEMHDETVPRMALF